jgi:hypothetical protein
MLIIFFCCSDIFPNPGGSVGLADDDDEEDEEDDERLEGGRGGIGGDIPGMTGNSLEVAAHV